MGQSHPVQHDENGPVGVQLGRLAVQLRDAADDAHRVAHERLEGGVVDARGGFGGHVRWVGPGVDGEVKFRPGKLLKG